MPSALDRLNELDLEKEAFAGSAIALTLRLIGMLASATGTSIDDVLVVVRQAVDTEFGR